MQRKSKKNFKDLFPFAEGNRSFSLAGRKMGAFFEKL